MSRITDSVINLGSGFSSLLNNANALYAIYFLAFFIGFYAMVNVALQKADHFRGKPAKVVAFMVTVIATGSIFYGKDVVTLIQFFNGFGWFLVILVMAIGFGWLGFYLYNQNKEGNKNLAMVYLSLGLYVASSLLLPQFDPTMVTFNGKFVIGDNSVSGWVNVASNGGGFIARFGGGAFNVFKDILGFVQPISLIVLIVYLIRLAMGVNVEVESRSAGFNNRANEKSYQKVKDIKDAKALLNGSVSELREMNNSFNRKVNLLNNLRRDIGNINPELVNNNGRRGSR